MHQRPDDCRGINVMKEKQLQFDFLLYPDSIKVASGIGQFAQIFFFFQLFFGSGKQIIAMGIVCPNVNAQ